MSNLLTRAISGSVYVALIVVTCLFTKLGFGILMLVFGVIGIYEFLNVTADRKVAATTRLGILSLDVVAVLSIILMSMSSCLDMSGEGGMTHFNNMMMYTTLFAILLVIYAIARVAFALFQKSGDPTRMLAYSVLGIIYVTLGLSCAVLLNMLSSGLVLLIFILIWLNDTGAYLSGRAFGRHKLCVHLSPKKTWEGFFGGLLICVIVGVVLSIIGVGGNLLVGGNEASSFTGVGWLLSFSSPVYLGIVLPVSVVVFSTAGDLFESMIKRNSGVKDSGRIIPGHGGVLDRIDSMLFAMPGTLLVLMLYVMFAM